MPLWRRIIGLPAKAIIALVRFYQVTLGPIVGRQCRFRPTCSNYMIEAVEKYGAVRGTARGIWRIIRCNPLCRGGYDPP